jgi:hypothetical protein
MSHRSGRTFRGSLARHPRLLALGVALVLTALALAAFGGDLA